MRRSGPAGLSGLCRVTDHLYLSNGRAANDPSQVTRCHITCIVNATETGSSGPPPPGVEYVHIPVSDSPAAPLSDHFDEVADRIQRTGERGGRTLVHCNAGGEPLGRPLHGLPDEAPRGEPAGGPQVGKDLPARGEAQRRLLEAAHPLRDGASRGELGANGPLLHGRDRRHL
ncbi:hypothetical protein L3Q82_006783 [Scortum barcoo]|uniref:Uncharacterized protein n=1 Tax=Scortum barcoo TaxID=214431 RepID=A0ACB8WVV9_9TELE|nr:hypothetical protein L3Q82_006783 [Scortum barcoo]